MTQDFEQALRDALHATPATPDAARTAAICAAAARTQKPPKRLGFAPFLGTQVRFIGWKIWLFQALVLLVANHTLTVALGRIYFLDATIAMRCLSCLSVLVLLTALPFLANATRYHMHELEAATYFSALQLLAAKLLIVGIGDVVMLAGLWLYALTHTPLSAAVLPLCLAAPFLAASAGLLTLLDRTTPQVVLLGSVGWCSLLGASGMLVPRSLLATSSATSGIILCTILTLYCLFALHRLLRHGAFTELQLFS